ncbi:MAG: hypothetical protein BWY74_01941 [Firmicutes bacterium ADurb.Bin419]|nr:MAG: hypothetical protein BWY74_01941 [Firmicutes bacterium ADurb.Bin419]
MALLSEKIKLDTNLTNASLGGAATGQYFPMNKYKKAVFVVNLGAMAAGATSTIQVMQAQDITGINAKVVTNNAATVRANINVSRAALTSAVVHVAGNTVTINQSVFTAAAADGGANSRIYAVGASAAASAANLAAKINSAIVGVPGVRAIVSGGTITLEADGENTITVTVSDGSVVVPSTLNATAFVECDASFLDLENGFNYISARVTNSAATLTGVTLIRGEGRYSFVQQVAASKTDVD